MVRILKRATEIQDQYQGYLMNLDRMLQKPVCTKVALVMSKSSLASLSDDGYKYILSKLRHLRQLEDLITNEVSSAAIVISSTVLFFSPGQIRNSVIYAETPKTSLSPTVNTLCKAMSQVLHCPPCKARKFCQQRT